MLLLRFGREWFPKNFEAWCSISQASDEILKPILRCGCASKRGRIPSVACVLSVMLSTTHRRATVSLAHLHQSFLFLIFDPLPSINCWWWCQSRPLPLKLPATQASYSNSSPFPTALAGSSSAAQQPMVRGHHTVDMGFYLQTWRVWVELEPFQA